jgi:hypothetical protein
VFILKADKDETDFLHRDPPGPPLLTLSSAIPTDASAEITTESASDASVPATVNGMIDAREVALAQGDSAKIVAGSVSTGALASSTAIVHTRDNAVLTSADSIKKPWGGFGFAVVYILYVPLCSLSHLWLPTSGKYLTDIYVFSKALQQPEQGGWQRKNHRCCGMYETFWHG